ncbi:MAG TPA: tetratricopeptide repeat protein [Anaerolineales bacterium]
MPGSEELFQQAMNEGHSAAWDQEWDKAAAAYRRALQEFPDHPRALNSLALALYQVADFEEALKTYMRVVQLSPSDPIAVEKVAQLSERLGDLNTAIGAAMRAADLYLNQREVDKALENWVRVTTLNPEHAAAHSRLALVHEKLGHSQQAVNEYLAIASLYQRSGDAAKTQQLVDRALQLMPASPEARQAAALLRTGQLLPKPVRSKGGTGPIRMAQVRELEKPREATPGLDPIAEARQKALTQLAEILFDYSDESPASVQRRGLAAIVRGTGQLALQQAEQSRVVLHLGQAIDALTHNQDAQAAEELDRVVDNGFSHAAVNFLLGLLRARGERFESAQRHLQVSTKHLDYSLASRLLQGELLGKKGMVREAAIEYLEALRLADSMTVPAEQAEGIRQMYEPIMEAQRTQPDEDALRRIGENVREFLLRADWRERAAKAREQLPRAEGGALLPLADVLLQAQASQVLESINRIHQLARDGHLRSAMSEAFDALHHAPTYLPLHTLIGDLLIQEGRTPEAITKFGVIAQAYSVRGEPEQATRLLRRVIQLAPMDLAARRHLIDQLVSRGQVDEAISEYLELADIYYRLAELDMARKTFTTALRIVQQSGADRAWNVRILQRMADIDMQRLDWKQAVRVFEQIRTLRPDDETVRRSLVDLNLRMGQKEQAAAEMDGFISYLESHGQNDKSINFLVDLIPDHEDQTFLSRKLAEQLHRAGRSEDALSLLDNLGESLLKAGRSEEAVEIVQQIIRMNPPAVNDYRRLLAQLQPGAA